ncbi:ADP-ribosylglycohydrolase family protein [Silvania hatchlandensis]|uniref:ADP-ribosylglycohydrolase family protein n=1 Tax=Silvania hatchlandensis TaxID=2926469 RepID=A0A9J6Q4H9_9ENTR|nr:ADP-ribosylglycohydrolase family protein [Silvania hatchlandensis]MCU6664502.1 ADP-ribosylglycohydrolase family protein [Silvania hatchlandensis]
MNSLRKQKVINSALWAAAGDAIGWISELTDESGLKRRINDTYLLKPVSWNRKIGGYSGVTVSLPAGTYSDDTQLRLAVSRSIRSNGEFDTESFAKIELPVWLSYALGAGKATKLAATNLMRKDTNWFSNFYKVNGIDYTNSGGNGTAMRIQPHVWSCKNLSERKYVASVIKDSLVTHGHVLAMCGALLHADTLQYALINGKPAGPTEINSFIDNFTSIPEVIHEIYELNNFWLPNWEIISGKKLHEEIERVRIESKAYLSKSLNAAKEYSDLSEKYKSAIDALECNKESRKGTATNTAIASALLCHFYKNSTPYEAIISCVNLLGTDTDSIGSMAGAILGCYSDLPEWAIQDNKYIISEASRLNDIAEGIPTKNFDYPNINKWQSPQTQSDTLVKNKDGIYHIIGLGKVALSNSAGSKNKNYEWQWMQLEYGQTILVKSKIGDIKLADPTQLRENELPLKNEITSEQMAISKESERQREVIKAVPSATSSYKYEQNSFNYDYADSDKLDLDDLTTNLIKNGFSEREIGHYLIKLADKKGLDSCVAFAAIIGKAFITRKKKQ